MIICRATIDDLDNVLDVERRAFGQDAEPELVRDLLSDPSAEPRMSLLAFVDDRPVGHILFTSVTLVGAQIPITASILAPLAVVPENQGQGWGGKLTGEGLR